MVAVWTGIVSRSWSGYQTRRVPTMAANSLDHDRIAAMQTWGLTKEIILRLGRSKATSDDRLRMGNCRNLSVHILVSFYWGYISMMYQARIVMLSYFEGRWRTHNPKAHFTASNYVHDLKGHPASHVTSFKPCSPFHARTPITLFASLYCDYPRPRRVLWR